MWSFFTSGGRVKVTGQSKVVSKTLQPADILVLHSSPFLILPAVAGWIYLPLFSFITYRFGTAPYVRGTGSTVFQMVYDGGAVQFNEGIITLEKTSDQETTWSNHIFTPLAASNSVGKAVKFTANGTADPTGGDGTLTAIYQYLLVKAP